MINILDPSATFTNFNSVGSRLHSDQLPYYFSQVHHWFLFVDSFEKVFIFLQALFFLQSLSFCSEIRVSMASETEAPEISSLFERLLRQRDLYFFLPFILGFSNNNSYSSNVLTENPEDPDQESSQESTSHRERIILINPFTQGMVVIEGATNLEALLRGWASKDGQPPASKASIEAMPCVEIGESEDGECVVCLEEWRPGEVAKEMPCKHKFHAECIEKWLGIHGSCPVCRYKMPVDEEEVGKKRDEERRSFGREIWVNFSFNSGRSNGDSNQVPSTDSDNDR